MLTAGAADAITERFDLRDDADRRPGGSRPSRLEGPVARGQLGQVWRLSTSTGVFAVKEWFAAPDLEAAESDARFTEQARAGAVCVPGPRRDSTGRIVAQVAGTWVRVSEWVDLQPPTRRLDPVLVGRTVAGLHGLELPADGPIEEWFARGIGEGAWTALHHALLAAGAPFASGLGRVRGELVAAESVLGEPEEVRLCHRDLWADNVLGTSGGAVCVIDFENHGPADRAHELAMVLYEFGDDEPDRARAIVTAYEAAGGPARVRERHHFTMLVAELVHIAQLAGRRWIETEPGPERDRLGAWFCEILDDPPTLARIDRVLAAIQPRTSPVE